MPMTTPTAPPFSDECAASKNNNGLAKKKKRRDWEAIFLIVVLVMQTICTVIGFGVFAYFVEKNFDDNRKMVDSTMKSYSVQMNELISQQQAEIKILKQNNEYLTSQIENLKKMDITRSPSHIPLHKSETETEKFKAVTVETFEHFPDIDSVNEEALEEESEEEYDYADEIPAKLPTFLNNNNNNTDHSVENETHPLIPSFGSVYSPHFEDREPQLQQKLINRQPQLMTPAALKNATHQNRFPMGVSWDGADSRLSSAAVSDKQNEDWGSNVKRNKSGRSKRNAYSLQDNAPSSINSIPPTAVESGRLTSPSAANTLWPAAHFDSHNPFPQTETKDPNDCPREIKSNSRKWKPTVIASGDYFDLRNNEYITIKKEGLYFVYSQIFFYRDKSMFGYSIENNKETILQCSIHSPVNRTKSGSGTSCFTAGLVYLNQDDVLRLELHNDSGRCVKWGATKSFIGLFKLPKELN